MMEMFGIIGMSFTIVICVVLLCLAIFAIKDVMYHLKRRYQYKHRFDKPPKAECYCIDCLYHNSNRYAIITVIPMMIVFVGVLNLVKR